MASCFSVYHWNCWFFVSIKTDSAFKQQRLPAWQPILTAGTVLPTFFVIGIAFIPVGIGLLYFSDEVKEFSYDYTNCTATDPKWNNAPCAEVIANHGGPCTCKIDFRLPMDFGGNVYMYYGLTNFYQNHRRYVKSRDDNQLLGVLSPIVSSDCEPFAYNGERPIAPCGAIANSLFSDELKLFWHNNRSVEEVPLIKTGIAWPSDKNIKFRNPPGDLKTAFKDFDRPKDWTKFIWELDESDPTNNGFQNEDLIVWMRTAALPTFRKLYRKVNNTQAPFTMGLLMGNYHLELNYCKFSLSLRSSQQFLYFIVGNSHYCQNIGTSIPGGAH